MKAHLIIADDHAILRQGLRDLVAHTSDLEVVAEAADGHEALVLARSQPADLLLLDVALPGMRGFEVLAAIQSAGIELPVLLYSMYPMAQYADAARSAGARGFVSKSADTEELLDAIRRILLGGTYFPRTERNAPKPEAAADPFMTLSRRENDVMLGLVRGANLLQIAADIGVGVKSVTTYRRRLLDKLGVRSNAELVALAAHHGRI
jgi:DNA-binding NarL/FixJ family response regulator